MENEPQDITTIPQLAAMVARGFSEVHTRIDGVETSMNARMNELDQKLGSVHHAVLMLSFDYNKLKARLETLELKTFGSIQEA
jgi:tetrahydromethanopterin S-methyltransferase subunit G